MNIRTRRAEVNDIERLMDIFSIARNFMKSTGNANQWIDGYPQKELILQEINQGHCYVCLDSSDKIVATFCLIKGPDFTYSHIEDGEWPSNSPYYVIHRLASDGSVKGIASYCIDWCTKISPCLRADTHADNKVMQHLLEKNGFKRCGIIFVANGTPRIAYQREKHLKNKKNGKFTIDVPGGVDKVLLHTCCAPCSSAIIECLLNNGIRPTVYYCNPNIYPLEEYNIRKTECTRYAQSLGLDIIDADYNHEDWLGYIKGLESEPERGGRCLRCFKMRLRETARYASENGFGVITTTLASSRWKSLDQINDAGHYAVEPYDNVVWWEQNWRKGGLSERRIAIIKEYSFYNQQYCGCEFSMHKKD